MAEIFGSAYTVPERMKDMRLDLVNIPFVHGEQGDAASRLPLPATFIMKPYGDGRPSLAFAQAHADHGVRPDTTDVLAAL